MLDIFYWIGGTVLLIAWVEFLLFFKDIIHTGKVKAYKAKASEKESFWIMIVVYIICLGIMAGEFWKYPPDSMSYAGYAGVALIFFGGMLRVLARQELDRFFTFQVIIQEGHKLITRGPFRYIRHPTYLGNILVMLGLSLALQTTFGIIAVIVFFIPAVIYRISAEEKLFYDEFGKEYLDYMEKTKKLFPFIY